MKPAASSLLNYVSQPKRASATASNAPSIDKIELLYVNVVTVVDVG